MRTLVDLLYLRTDAYAKNLLYAYLGGDHEPAQHLTYEELTRRVYTLGEQLKTRHLQGARVLLFYPSGPDYIVAFFSCLYAGITAVPLYPPRKNQSVKRILSVMADAQPAAILTTEKISRYAQALFTAAGTNALPWIITDQVQPVSPAAVNWNPVNITADEVAFLQFTSGSVGQPKGVMVTHENLLQNQEMIFKMFGYRQSPVMVSWLPLYHDMGLICKLLQPLFAGGSLYLMSPADFLQKPYRWLKAISEYKAAISGAPNFAYELCTQRITPEQRSTLDLSGWEIAFNGAETVNAHTLEQFYQTFKECGFRKEYFYPSYGMAEATLLVTGLKQAAVPYHTYQADARLLQQHVLQQVDGADPQQQTVSLVSCGMPVLQEVRIVHPVTLEELSNETIGEIWVNGSNVTKGYRNNASLTKETFEATLESRPEQHFLRTGDLGFMKDGELYVTGRLKELIIIRGRNIYPQDVERVVETAHDALQPFAGAAFAVMTAGTEQLVVVQELKRTHSREPDVAQITAAIRAAVTDQLDISLHAIWLLRASAIPKTSSGKIQRIACKKAFLEQDENALLVIGKWEAAEDNVISAAPTAAIDLSLAMITEWLKKTIAQQCNIPATTIQAQDAFDKFGLDSMAAAHIASALSEWMGVEVRPTLIYDYPDIASLAARLYQSLHGKQVMETQQAVLPAVDDPIAVVGIGCRFPEAPDRHAFWNLIRQGKSAIHTVPAGRWPMLPEAALSGYEFIRSGGFLDSIDAFDAGFFGISAGEAAKMDPQQRFLLEVSWEAFEDAGIAPASLGGQPVGVFVGISANDYARLQQDPALLDAWHGTGNAASIAANRLSYFYDFRGPSLSIDTACSSSLVAVHHACKSLQQQECSVALAAGVNIMAAPDLSLVFAKAGMLSPDGLCKTFDASANGYVRGEGCGVVILKRLTDAVRDGDRIYGIIKGSAVNQDGRTNGLTAPNGPSQEAVIRAALAAAKVPPQRVNFIEAHGTGTALGDPIEMNALLQVLSTDRAANDPCYVGAVKTNIGHLEAAAGIAGLIKVLLCLHHREVAPHLHTKELNPHIQHRQACVVIPANTVPLNDRSHPLIAGVSAFGFGGTNAHVIVEEHPAGDLSKSAELLKSFSGPHLVLLSAADESVLPAMAGQLRASLELTETGIRDIAATLMQGRNHLPHRMAWVAGDKNELKDKLQDYLQMQSTPGNPATAPLVSPRLAMLFTGQGAQYAMMAQGLYEREPVFRETLDACSRYLQPHIGVSLTELLYVQQDDQQIHQTAITQPALFAVEVSLAKLWASWGIVPAAVMGHSVGEIAAACIAGVFSMEEGLQLIAARGALMQALPAGGQMWALMATAEQVQPFLQGFEKHISIASINAPNQVVIAGDGVQLKQVVAALQSRKIVCNPLKVSHAFHSPLMAPMLDAFLEKIRHITFRAPQIPLLSNVSGTWAAKEIATPEYWARHIMAPVLFSKSIQVLRQQGFNIFLEAGPHPVLNNLARQTLGMSADLLLLPSIINKGDNNRDILQSLGALYTQGFAVNGNNIYPAPTFHKAVLPAYPFKRERHWLSQEEMLPPAGTVHSPAAAPERAQIYRKQWEQSAAVIHQHNNEPSIVLAITDDIPLLTVLLQNGFGQKKQLILLVPESLKDTLAPGMAREHQIIYHKGDSVDLYRSILQDLLQHKPTICNIILAFNLHNPAYTPTETPVKVQYPYYNRILYILQAISSLSVKDEVCRLLLFTPAYSQVSNLPLYPPAAVLAAMLRSARLEMPELKIKTIETTITSQNDWRTILDTELSATSFTEMEVAYQHGQRYVSRLKESTITIATTARPLFEAEKVLLITGGTSSMVTGLLAWMISRGACHFLLVSRKAPQRAYLQKLHTLVATVNGSITWCLADVASDTAVDQLQEQLRILQKPLGGIFHLAGVLKDGPIHQLSWQDMEPVFAPKVAGTLHLHQLSLQHNPAYFVCFSSVTALLGGFYQCSYAAANAFMDAFAAWRLQQGLPAQSINWGPWEGEGMAKGALAHKMAGVELIHKTSLAQNLDALELVLTNRLSNAAVISFNRQSAGSWLAGIPFLQQVTGMRYKERAVAAPGPSLGRQLLAYTKEEQQRQLSRFITQELQQIIGVRKITDPDEAFAAMGMDSMMTIALQQKLQQLLELHFSAAAIYNYNTIRTLTAFLLEKLRVQYKKPEPVTPAFTLFHTDIDTLSEAAATALLEEVLSNKKITL